MGRPRRGAGVHAFEQCRGPCGGDNLALIDHKIGVYRGRLAAGDADQLWAPTRLAGARGAIPD